MAKTHKLYVISDPEEGIIFVVVDLADERRPAVAAVHTLKEIGTAGFDNRRDYAVGFATEFDNHPDVTLRTLYKGIIELIEKSGVPSVKFCIGIEQTLEELQTYRRAGYYIDINSDITEVAGAYRTP